jgi:hypothetical protein
VDRWLPNQNHDIVGVVPAGRSPVEESVLTMRRWLAAQACAHGLEEGLDLRAQREQGNKRRDGNACEDEAVLNQPLALLPLGDIGPNLRRERLKQLEILLTGQSCPSEFRDFRSR